MKTIILLLALACSTTISAQNMGSAAEEHLDTLWAKKYNGISGPGYPVEGNGYGGWKSGGNGVAYSGNHPRPEYNLPWGDKVATASAIDAGLTPPILPLLEVHVRDAVVTLGGDGYYYMTGSTGDNIWAYAKGIELWRSPDLKKWEYVGLVWDIDKEADPWVKSWRKYGKGTGHGVRAVWAPEIHYLPKHQNYYIVFSMCPGGVGILKSSTGKAEGPYVNAWAEKNKMVVKGIDPTLFEDEDGKVYFTWSSGNTIRKLKDDLSGWDGEAVKVKLEPIDNDSTHHARKCVRRGMTDFGHEGAVLFKYGGKYYLGGADSYGGRYSSCIAISDNIYGPYTMRHEPVPCDGGTNFFTDKQGRLWSSYFGNDEQSHFREKPGLIRAEVTGSGRIIPALDQPFVPESRKAEWEANWNRVWKPIKIAEGKK